MSLILKNIRFVFFSGVILMGSIPFAFSYWTSSHGHSQARILFPVSQSVSHLGSNQCKTIQNHSFLAMEDVSYRAQMKPAKWVSFLMDQQWVGLSVFNLILLCFKLPNRFPASLTILRI